MYCNITFLRLPIAKQYKSKPTTIFHFIKILPKSCHGNERTWLGTFPGLAKLERVPWASGWWFFCNWVLDKRFFDSKFCISTSNYTGTGRTYGLEKKSNVLKMSKNKRVCRLRGWIRNPTNELGRSNILHLHDFGYNFTYWCMPDRSCLAANSTLHDVLVTLSRYIYHIL